MEALISLALILPVLVLFAVLIRKTLTPAWDVRGNYGYDGKQWNRPITLSVIFAAIFTPIIVIMGSSLFVGIALGLLSFFLALTGMTDAKTHLIPRELSNVALIVGAITSVVGFATSQYYDPEYLMSKESQFTFQLTHFGIYMLAISLLFVLIMFQPVIGFGDIKMFWATGLFIGSFFMITTMMAVFMLAFVLMGFQIAWRMVKAKSWKVSGGVPALPAFAAAFISITVASSSLSYVTY